MTGTAHTGEMTRLIDMEGREHIGHLLSPNAPYGVRGTYALTMPDGHTLRAYGRLTVFDGSDPFEFTRGRGYARTDEGEVLVQDGGDENVLVLVSSTDKDGVRHSRAVTIPRSAWDTIAASV